MIMINVIDLICKYFGISYSQLISASRESKVVSARHLCIYILSVDFSVSDKDLPKMVGRKSRSLVYSVIKKIDNLKVYDKELVNDLSLLRHYIYEDIPFKSKIETIIVDSKKRIYMLDYGMDTLDIFDTVKLASIKTGVSVSTISRSLNSYKRLGRGAYWVKK